MNERTARKILIFGSCVSRDPFTDNVFGFKLVDYYARSSFASLSGEKFTSPLDLSLIESKFQRRMIQRDASKLFLEALSLLEYDILT